MGPVEKLAAQFLARRAGAAICAADGEFLNAAGIPAYGIEPLFLGPDFGHMHGLNEYVASGCSLMQCRDFLYGSSHHRAEVRCVDGILSA